MGSAEVSEARKERRERRGLLDALRSFWDHVIEAERRGEREGSGSGQFSGSIPIPPAPYSARYGYKFRTGTTPEDFGLRKKTHLRRSGIRRY